MLGHGINRVRDTDNRSKHPTRAPQLLQSSSSSIKCDIHPMLSFAACESIGIRRWRAAPQRIRWLAYGRRHLRRRRDTVAMARLAMCVIMDVALAIMIMSEAGTVHASRW